MIGSVDKLLLKGTSAIFEKMQWKYNHDNNPTFWYESNIDIR